MDDAAADIQHHYYSIICWARSRYSCRGGMVKYLRLPLFQSSTTSLAPCFISGTPPLPSFPCARQILARKSTLEVKGSILQYQSRSSLGMRSRIASITSSSESSYLAVFCRMSWLRVRSFSKMTPGQSSSFTWLSSFTSCSALVQPGMLETSQALLRLRLLMTLLLPTLGQPMRPTVTARLEPSTLEICLMSWMRWSVPMALVEWMSVSAMSVLSAMDFLKRLKEERWLPWLCRFALNITTGNSRRRQVCHAYAFSIGTRSILLSTSTIFLSAIDRIFRSMYLHLQESGSRASRISRMISQFSMIFFISFQYLPDSWKFFPSNISNPSSSGQKSSSNSASSIRCLMSGTFSFSRFQMVLSRLASLLLRDWIILLLNWARSGGLLRFLLTAWKGGYVSWRCPAISGS